MIKKRRFLSMLLAFCMFLAAMPAMNVFAETTFSESGIKLAYGPVEGTYTCPSGGTVEISCSEENQCFTIVLDNAVITTNESAFASFECLRSGFDVKVILKGTNEITCNQRAFSMNEGNSTLTIEGTEESSLTINSNTGDAIGASTDENNTVWMKNANVTIKTVGSEGINVKGNYLSENSLVTINAENGNGITASDNMIVTGGALKVEKSKFSAIHADKNMAFNGATVVAKPTAASNYAIFSGGMISFKDCPDVTLEAVDRCLYKSGSYDKGTGILIDNSKIKMTSKDANAIDSANDDILIKNNSDVDITGESDCYSVITAGEYGEEEKIDIKVENSKLKIKANGGVGISGAYVGDVLFQNAELDFEMNNGKAVSASTGDIVFNQCRNVKFTSTATSSLVRSDNGDIKVTDSTLYLKGGTTLSAWSGNLEIKNSAVEAHSTGLYGQMFRSGKTAFITNSELTGDSEAAGFYNSNLKIENATVDIKTGTAGYVEYLSDGVAVLKDFVVTGSSISIESAMGMGINTYHSDETDVGFEAVDDSVEYDFYVKDSELNLKSYLADPNQINCGWSFFALAAFNSSLTLDNTKANIDYDIKTGAGIYSSHDIAIVNGSEINIDSVYEGIKTYKGAVGITDSAINVDSDNVGIMALSMKYSGPKKIKVNSHNAETLGTAYIGVDKVQEGGTLPHVPVKVENGAVLILENDDKILNEKKGYCFQVDETSALEAKRGTFLIGETVDMQNVNGTTTVDGIIAKTGLVVADIASMKWSGNGAVEVESGEGQSYYTTKGAALTKAEVAGYNGNVAVYYDAAIGNVTAVYEDGKITLTSSTFKEWNVAYGNAQAVDGNVVTVPADENEKLVMVGIAKPQADIAFAGSKDHYDAVYGDEPFDLAEVLTNSTGNVSYEVVSGDAVSVLGKKVTVVKAGDAIIRATVAETDAYRPVYKDITVHVAKADTAPDVPELTIMAPYSAKKVSDVTLSSSNWSWLAADVNKELVVGETVTARAVYVGTGKGNYENEEVTVSITRKAECCHEHFGNWMEDLTTGNCYRTCTDCNDYKEICNHEGEELTEWAKDPFHFEVYRACSKCGHVMERESYSIGDVDGNGQIQADDALAILKYVVGINEMNLRESLSADANRNGRIEAEDALQVLKHVVGIIDSFLAE